MGAPISSLRDDFLDNTIAAAWNAVATGSATVAETSGQARFTLPSSTAGTHTARYTSRVTYDITGDWFPINIGTMVATGVAATAFFQYYYGSGANTLQWLQTSGTLTAQTVIAGVTTVRYSAAWNATTYKYLAISEGGGNITWWSSTNGTSWTSRFTMAAPFAVTDLFIDFGATCGNVASPGSFRVEDVNLILPALTTTWRWTQARRALVNRNRVTTLACDTANTVQGYLVTADGVDSSDAPSGNVRYWAGPMDAGRALTEQPTEAAAQAMAVNLPLDGRFDLPEMIDMRVVRLGHRSIDGASYILREFFPRRLVQADDIEAESIRALHIAAGSITADRLSVGQLSAITADAGTLTAGVINGVTIYAGALNDVILDINGMTLLPGGNIAWSAGGPGTSEVAISYASGQWTLGAVGKKIRLSTSGSVANTITLSTEFSAPVIISAPIQSSGIASLNGFTPAPTTVALGVKGLGTTNTTAAFSALNSAGAINGQFLDDGTVRTRTGPRWDLRGYVGGTVTATGHVDVMIDGTVRQLLAR